MVEPTVENLQRQTDLELVCEGGPAYLLMIDSLVAGDHDNDDLLLTATQAYSAYVSALDACGRKERAAVLSRKARDYGMRLLSCCHVAHEEWMSAENIDTVLRGFSGDDVERLFWGSYGWAIWLQYQGGSPAALADLYKVEKIMERVMELDEGYYHGAVHLFMGAYYGSRPRMLGGKPEESLRHFRRALELGHHEFLPTQVSFAEVYARSVFDRQLYVELLQEVLDFPIETRPDIALANRVAQRRARQLLDEVDLYF